MVNIIQIFCNMCDATFTSMSAFDEHWEETHAFCWGRNICKNPKVILEVKTK